MPIVISVENLSKSYRLGQIGTGTFSRDLKVWWARARGKPNPLLKIGQADHGNRDGEELWALRDVSFTVEQGEVLGIIGRNGAGKSTLLKILSRVTAPTSGRIRVKGRVASLLEVGTGFHPELTGRENVYLNGAILGMSKQEVTRKFDEIVDFAGVEKFIDTPVKRYSSGMYVRLAFAVAAHLDPEILVVDEVLAVGDAEFQKKCLGKMGDVARGGRTVLFVSHNMGAVKQLCNHGIVLDKGMIVLSGDIQKCIYYYIGSSHLEGRKISDHIKTQDNNLQLDLIEVNGASNDKVILRSGDNQLNFIVAGSLLNRVHMDLEVRIKDAQENVLALYSPGHMKGYAPCFEAGTFKLERLISLPPDMTRGDYYLSISLADPNRMILMDAPRALHLAVEGTPTDTGRLIEYSSGAGWLMLR